MSESKGEMSGILFDPAKLGQLTLASLPVPAPGDNDVLVEVVSAGLNPVDSAIANSNPFGLKSSRVLGEDFSGVVRSTGTNVKDFKVGDEVFGVFSKTGALANFVVAEQSNVAHKPKSLSHAEAGAFGLVALTAIFGVDDAKLQSTDVVFVPGGAGGVAHLVIQFAKLAGARVITSASNEKAIKYLKDTLKVDVINYKTHNTVEEVKKLTDGKGADVIFDCIWALSEYAAAVRKDGRYFAIHTARTNDKEPKELLEGKAQFHHFSVVPTWLSPDSEFRTKRIQGNLKRVAELHAAGKLTLLIGKTITLAATIAELDDMFRNYARGTFGKTVVLVKAA